MKSVIGRKKEKQLLDKVLQGDKSEFLAFYGRRRIGKTFLIREYLKDKFDFQLTGLANADTGQQLFNFQNSYNRQAVRILENAPKNWLEAFEHLKTHIEMITDDRKKIIFLDEVPWMDTAKSDFITGLENFWNSWAAYRNDIILITCGSAASWMINQLINNHGGLHNRVTHQVHIEPFTLSETEALLEANSHICTRYQIIQLYMITGGVPFYLERLDPQKSIMQNIDDLCFHKGGLLRQEYPHLFRSLFKKYQKHELIAKALSKKTIGLTRKEILTQTKLKSGGTFTSTLEELALSGFITSYSAIDKKSKETLYRLSDFYTLFYFKFIEDNPTPEPNYWINRIDDPAHRAWSGYAFEQVCLAHQEAIKKAIGITGVRTEIGSWRGKADNKGVQIDLLIKRKDGVTNICEMKYSINPFTITKDYAANLRNKIGIYRSASRTRDAVQLVMTTTYGLKRNAYSDELVHNEVTMDDLFE